VGLSALLSWLNALYQDVSYTVAILLQFGFFLTPILWKPEQLARQLALAEDPFKRHLLETANFLLQINPMAVLVSSYRSIFMDRLPPDWGDIGMVAIHAVLAFVVGYLTFRHVQWKLVEEI
jgi:ABC-type polysaccharide/polyol phosphate export permease